MPSSPSLGSFQLYIVAKRGSLTDVSGLDVPADVEVVEWQRQPVNVVAKFAEIGSRCRRGVLVSAKLSFSTRLWSSGQRSFLLLRRPELESCSLLKVT